MKIVRVIVDEMPEDCIACRFSYWYGGDYTCRLLTINEILPTKRDERHHDCPLALEHDNKKIANEVM